MAAREHAEALAESAEAIQKLKVELGGLHRAVDALR